MLGVCTVKFRWQKLQSCICSSVSIISLMLLSLFCPVSFANRIPHEWVSKPASPNRDYFHTYTYIESYITTQAAPMQWELWKFTQRLRCAQFRHLTGEAAVTNPLFGHDARETAEIQTRMKDLSVLWMWISVAVKKWQPYTSTAAVLDVKHTSL